MPAFRPFRLQSPSVVPVIAFVRSPSAERASCDFAGLGFAPGWQARRARPAESSSLSYGLVVHLPLLPTSSRNEAVTFSYRPESVCLERTFTSLAGLLSGAPPPA